MTNEVLHVLLIVLVSISGILQTRNLRTLERTCKELKMTQATLAALQAIVFAEGNGQEAP